MTRAIAGIAVALAAGLPSAIAAPVPQMGGDLWQLPIGARAEELPQGFVQFACGTDGGPPSLPIAGWGEYGRCPADDRGLHEVAFRYDDQEEFVARAHGLQTPLTTYGSTTIDNFPVVVSALFDESGILRGLRAITDPSAGNLDSRARGVLLGGELMRRFGEEGWSCHDLPAAERETSVGDRFIKQHCSKRVDGLSLGVDMHFYRKPGQTALDPVTGLPTVGLYESSTRFEMLQTAAAEQGGS